MVRLSSRAWLSALAVAVVAMATTMAAPPVAVPPKVTAPNNATTTVASATHTSNFVLPSGAPGPKPTSPTTSGNQTMTQCPGPLIANTQGLKIKTCMGNCCIKCPAFESLYEPDEVQRVLRMAYYTRQVSLGFAVFMAISYLCLPGKKAQPHISVLFLTVSLSLWYAAFDIMPGVSNACANDFEQSTGHNSRLCGVQGVLIVYLTQTSALWCSLLIYKLHLVRVVLFLLMTRSLFLLQAQKRKKGSFVWFLSTLGGRRTVSHVHFTLHPPPSLSISISLSISVMSTSITHHPCPLVHIDNHF